MAPRAYRSPSLDRTIDELTRMYIGRNQRIVSARTIIRIRKAMRWKSPELQAQFEGWALEQQKRYQAKYGPVTVQLRGNLRKPEPNGTYNHQTGSLSYSLTEQIEWAVNECRRDYGYTLTHIVREALKLYLADYLPKE